VVHRTTKVVSPNGGLTPYLTRLDELARTPDCCTMLAS
jgi:hypothetical protein